MEKWLQECPKLNIAMIILAILAFITFSFTPNWQAAIWAFNTTIWVFMASDYEIENKHLKNKKTTK